MTIQCKTCEGDGEVASNFGIHSTGRPEIVPCPDCSGSGSQLVLERRDQPDKTGIIGGAVMFTPPISEDYWEYRVVVGEGQAIVGFPKFTTIGVGFAKEEDWNTNLPYTVDALDIFGHISHNKGDDSIPDEVCIEAIKMIQEAVKADRGELSPSFTATETRFTVQYVVVDANPKPGQKKIAFTFDNESDAVEKAKVLNSLNGIYETMADERK